MTMWFYKRACTFRYYRDRVSSLYTYSYGIFRDIFLQIGRNLTNEGLLNQPDDIFYLELQEVRNAVSSPEEMRSDLSNLAGYRKSEMERYREVALPSVIYGDETPPVESGFNLSYEGLPASAGYYNGKCVIVKGFSDFNRVTKGDVIVIPYSDVGWTPVFIRAGAIIAESGGILSHSAIVARELNIPAVVSVDNACRIPEGTLVSVDGYKGKIVIN
jgi:pyruvate,water dikinase